MFRNLIMILILVALLGVLVGPVGAQDEADPLADGVTVIGEADGVTVERGDGGEIIITVPQSNINQTAFYGFLLVILVIIVVVGLLGRDVIKNANEAIPPSVMELAGKAIEGGLAVMTAYAEKTPSTLDDKLVADIKGALDSETG